MSAMPFANAPKAETTSGVISGPRPPWMSAGEWTANTDARRRELIAAEHPDYSLPVLRARLRSLVVFAPDGTLNNDDRGVLNAALDAEPHAAWASAEAAQRRAGDKQRAHAAHAQPLIEAPGWGKVDRYGDPVEEQWERDARLRCEELDRAADLLAAARYVAMLASGYEPAHLWAARAIDALEVAS